MAYTQHGDEVDPESLSVHQIAALLGLGQLTEERLGDTRLADAFWDLERALARTLGPDPAFCSELRERLMQETRGQAGDKGAVEA